MRDGLNGLSAIDQQRILLANQSYQATTDLVLELIHLGVSVSIENPKNPLYWLTSMALALFKAVPQGHCTIFDNCMHGGTRDKATKFWAFNPRTPEINMFASLELQCDKQHVHQSWRPRFVNGSWVFPTKEEAAYPVLLCDRMATLFLDEASHRGLAPDTTLLEQLQHDATSGKRQLFTTQSRQHKLKPLVAEFGRTAHIAVPLTAGNTFVLPSTYPKGSKIISRHLQRGFKRDVFMAYSGAHVFGQLAEDEDFEVLKVGVPWEPQQFIKEAVKVGHPRFLLARVQPEAARAIDALFDNPGELKARRAEFLKHWSKRAMEL